MQRGFVFIRRTISLYSYYSEYNVVSVFEDRRKNLWVSTIVNGLYKTNKQFDVVSVYKHNENDKSSISSDDVRTVCEDRNGTIWVGTFTGLNKYLEKENGFRCYTHVLSQPSSINNPSVYSLMCDQQGTVWAGTYYGGVNYFNPDVNIFNFYYPNTNDITSLNNSIIGKMVEDERGNIWVATEGGLNYFERNTQSFTHIVQSGKTISNNTVKVLLIDPKRQKLFMGSHFGGLDVIDLKTKKSMHFNAQMPDGMKIINNAVYSMALSGDSLIFSTQTQIYTLSLPTYKVKEFNIRIINNEGHWANPLFIDSEQNLWLYFNLSTEVIKYNLLTHKKATFSLFPRKSIQNSIGITAIIEDRNKQIWFSSNGGGLFLYKPNSTKLINFKAKDDGLLSDYCYALAVSKYGNILISTNHGLSRYQPSTNNFKNLRLQDGVSLTAINEGNGLLVATNGEVFWGGVNGLASFFEQQISNVNKSSKIYFSDLEVNNKRVNVNDKTEILNESLNFKKSISLKSTDAIISVFFGTTNYIKANACEYEYRLEGLSDEWIRCSNNRIPISNLPRGKYQLTVRGKYLNSATYTDEIKLGIRVNPPFYASSIAFIIYAIVLILITLYLLRILKREVNLESSLAFEKKEKERIEEINQYKLRFFTNISHEFRTPITLIIAQIESLLERKNEHVNPDKLQSVYRNAAKMNNLLTELLDFRKQEQGYMKIRVNKQNIVAFVRNIFNSFKELADKNKIKYRFYPEKEEVDLYIDAIQFQKVINNLLSNAFKFTPSGCRISLSIKEMSGRVYISVSDTGKGIDQESLQFVFNRFYQVKGAAALEGGTGIGLALSKGIVDLHGGEIFVESESGVGTNFTVALRMGNEHFTEEQKEESPINLIDSTARFEILERTFFDEISKEFIDASNQKRYKMLVVEDNEEIIQLLVSAFEMFYQVEWALNGKEGLEAANRLQPDIILTDLMMPEMNGSEMLLKLKSNIDTSHIPVIMITANTSEQYMEEGLQFGVDDYVTKPFNMKHLIIRCNNLVRSRKLLQEKYSNEMRSNLDLVAHNRIDMEFMEKINTIIEKNIESESFTIDDMAQEMNIGRNKVYSKIKGITGLTPNDLIQNIRLKNAVHCLKNNPELSIAEIAYKFGFGTPQYFSKCFKASFNITPSLFRSHQIEAIE